MHGESVDGYVDVTSFVSDADTDGCRGGEVGGDGEQAVLGRQEPVADDDVERSDVICDEADSESSG